MTEAGWTSGAMRKLIRERCPKESWAVLFEVRSETGSFGAGRYADALAMSLWPSRGLELHGFEIKVSRSDWRRELEKPEKAEPIQRFCDRWWIVAPASVVLVEELPPTWGLLVPDAKGESLRVFRQAPKMEGPRPLDRSFVASVLRSAQSQITPEVEIERVRREASEAAMEQGLKLGTERAERRARDLYESVAEFEKASGVQLSSRPFHAADIGAAVKLVLGEGGHNGVASRMKRAEAALRLALEAVEVATGTRSVPT